MEKKSTLFKKLKSAFILQNILSFAYGDIKSVLKLIKYNKYLLTKLDINIKDYYNYKLKIKIEKYSLDIAILLIFHIIFVFFPYLIYIICFFIIGTFNDKNLKEGYDKKKKSFVDFMDNYISLIYFLFIIISYLLFILLNICSIIYLKGLCKTIYYTIFNLVDLSHYILFIIKYSFTKRIIKKELIEEGPSILTWFYSFDIALIFLISFTLFINLMLNILTFCLLIEDLDDIKLNSLLEINGIKINEFKLASEFDSLNEKSKNEFVFEKENIEKYRYELNENQINTINKINDIRKNNNVSKLKFDKNEIIIYIYLNMTKMNSKIYLIIRKLLI